MLSSFEKRLKLALIGNLESKKRQLKRLSESYYFKRPMELINKLKIRLDIAEKGLVKANDKCMIKRTNEYIKVVNKLDALSPLKTLARGYSVAMVNDRVIKNKDDVKVNESFVLRLNDGEIKAVREE